MAVRSVSVVGLLLIATACSSPTGTDNNVPVTNDADDAPEQAVSPADSNPLRSAYFGETHVVAKFQKSWLYGQLNAARHLEVSLVPARPVNRRL